MRTLAFTVLALIALAGHAAHAKPKPTDGTVADKQPLAFPPHADLGIPTKRFLTPALYDQMKQDSSVAFTRFTYTSGGLRVIGIAVAPRTTKQRPPLVVWLHGGFGDESKLAGPNFEGIYEMWRLAQAGFMVVAPQFRGIDGGEGTEDIAGDGDVADVTNIVRAAATLGADTKTVRLHGYSRGALVALVALRRGIKGTRIAAVAVVGVPPDWRDFPKRDPQRAKQLGLADAKPDDPRLVARSPLLWAEELRSAPLLLLNGGADSATPAAGLLAFTTKLDAAGALYELVIYAKDDHPTNANRDDRIRRAIDWFTTPRKMSIAQLLQRAIAERGVDAAIREYRQLKKTRADEIDFDERELNLLGYRYLFQNDLKTAERILALNAEMFPKSANVWDSYAEAVLATGDTKRAIELYKKSLQLDPKNDNAKRVLERIDVPAKPAK